MTGYAAEPVNDLHEALAGRATLVVPGRRLARVHRERYDQSCRDRGLLAWESPRILTWEAWLGTLWDAVGSSSEPPRAWLPLLGETQALSLWRGIVERERRTADPFGRFPEPAALTDALAAAWALAHALCLDPDSPAFGETAETRLFRRCAREYRADCERLGRLDRARLAALLPGMIGEGLVADTGTIVLGGFLEFTPAQAALLEALRARGVALMRHDPPRRTSRMLRVDFADVTHQARAMAAWVRGRLEARPDARIAIVTPALEGVRSILMRALEDALVPSRRMPGALSVTCPVNVSLGVPLADWPVIACALELIAWFHAGLPIDRAGGLWRAPWLRGASTESDARARLEGVLRREGNAWTSPALLAALKTGASRTALAACPELTRTLAMTSELPERAMPMQWCRWWSERLAGAGWPQGGRALDSTEQQTVEAWHDLLDALAGLDAVGTAWNADEARAHLREAATHRSFQPRTPAVPVQVLGVLEALDLGFDHLWLFDFDDTSWPLPPAPDPFLPLGLQKARRMNRADTDLARAFAAGVLDRLLPQSGEVVAGLSRMREETEARISPSLAHVPLVTAGEAGISAPSPDALWPAITVEPQRNDERNVEAIAPGTVVRGGTWALAAQAACPFQAFARYRLDAQAPQEVAEGLSARERGTLVHAVLEEVWAGLRDRDGLRACTADDLATRIDTAVDAALGGIRRVDRDAGSDPLLVIERARLVALVTQWLDQERERTPFTVHASEEECRATLAGLVFRMRADRIDRLDDGRLLIVDYKTGTGPLSTSRWAGDRLDDPQLPCYALTAEEPVAGVAFAAVRNGDCKFVGVAAEDGLAPGIQSLTAMKGSSALRRETVDFTTLMDAWRRRVETLARQFADGVAVVDPKRRGQTCRLCDLKPLCRIGDASMDEEDEDEEVED